MEVPHILVMFFGAIILALGIFLWLAISLDKDFKQKRESNANLKEICAQKSEESPRKRRNAQVLGR